jgi:hypothetical protein
MQSEPAGAEARKIIFFRGILYFSSSRKERKVTIPLFLM